MRSFNFQVYSDPVLIERLRTPHFIDMLNGQLLA